MTNRGHHLARVLILTGGLVAPAVALNVFINLQAVSLPIGAPQDLVKISGISQPRQADLSDWFGSTPRLSGITVASWGRATWVRRAGSERVDLIVSDHALLPVLGLTPSEGRGFDRRDLSEPGVALVTEGFRRRAFPGRPVLGEVLVLNGQAFQVVGVVPDALRRLGRVDIIVPRYEHRYWGLNLGTGSALAQQMILGRLAPGTSVQELLREMERLQRLQETTGGGHSTVSVTKLIEVLSGPVIPTLRAAATGAAAIFALALVAVFMLAALHTIERFEEFSIRIALGATRVRVGLEAFRPWMPALLTSTALAVSVGSAIVEGIRRTLPSLGDAHPSPGLSWGGIALVAGVLGLVAAAGSQLPLAYAQAAGLNLSIAQFRRRRGSLVSLGMAVACALTISLLCGALTATIGMARQAGRPIGIEPGGVSTLAIDLGENLTREQALQAWAALDSGLGGQPLALISFPPWIGNGPRLWVGGSNPSSGTLSPVSYVMGTVVPTLRIPLLSGIDPFVGKAISSEVLLSKSLADRLKVGIGGSVSVGDDPRRVAGVVADVEDPFDAPESPRLRVYESLSSARATSAILVGRMPGSALPGVKASVERLIPSASVAGAVSLDALLLDRLQTQKLWTAVLNWYAVFATVLTALGLHALAARLLVQRSRELGIRLALGATNSAVQRALFGPLLLPGVSGLAGGMGLGYLVSLQIAAAMTWANPTEARTYFAVLVLALVVAGAAAAPVLTRAARLQVAQLIRDL